MFSGNQLWRTRSIFHGATRIVVLSMLACEPAAEGREPDAPDIALHTAALNGDYEIENCSAIEESQARTALDMIRNMVADGSLRECLKNAVLGGYHAPVSPWWPTSVAMYPEHIVRALSQNIPTYLECSNGSTAGTGWEGVFIDHSWFAQNQGDVNPTQMAGLVQIIAHELGHTKGYSDGPEGNASGLNLENPFIVPEQLAACASRIANPQALDLPNGAARAGALAQTGDVVLAAVGSLSGGAPNPQMQCSLSEFARGFQGRAGAEVDAIGLVCPTVSFTPKGGSGGSSFTLTCPAGQVLIGAHGRADGVLQRVGTICGDQASVQAGIGSDLGDGPAVGGGPSANYFFRVCPTGHAVKGMRLRVGARVDRLELVCQRMSSPRSISLRHLPRNGGTGGSTTTVETCPSRSAMYKLVSTADPAGGIGRLSGACKVVSNAGQNGQVTVAAAPSAAAAHFVPGVGTMASGGFEAAEDYCQGLLVGIDVQTDGWIRAVSGLCVDSTAPWSTGSGSEGDVIGMTWRGPDLGGVWRTRCPVGEFMVGLKGTSGNFLDSIEVICRRF